MNAFRNMRDVKNMKTLGMSAVFFLIIGMSVLAAAPVKITFYNTSATTNSQFERLFNIYMTHNPDVTVELIPTTVGQGQLEKYEVLYASGNAPGPSTLDASYSVKFKDKLLPFSTASDPYLNQALPGALEGGTFDGKLRGIPFTVARTSGAKNLFFFNNITRTSQPCCL